jgi:putative transposase
MGILGINAVTESFVILLKKELVSGNVYRIQAAARDAIIEYTEVFYNRRRKHSLARLKNTR